MKIKASSDKAFFVQRMTAAVLRVTLSQAGFITTPVLGKDSSRNPSGSGKGKQQMKNAFQQMEVTCSRLDALLGKCQVVYKLDFNSGLNQLL